MSDPRPTPLNEAKKKAEHKLQQFILESQTLPMKDASFGRKVLAFLYKLMGRKLLAKLLVTSSRCVSCRHCETVCPQHAIAFRLGDPRRDRRCTGCLWCVYQCPERAFELPLGILVGAFLLLWLPYDEYIGRIFSFTVLENPLDPGQIAISLLLWSIGYVIAVFILGKVSFLVSAIPLVKRLRQRPFFRKIALKIHPATIFPIIIPPDQRKKR